MKTHQSKIDRLIAKMCPNGVEFKELWKITNWDKKFSGFFKKETNNNTLTDDHIADIIDIFDKKENIPHVAQSVPCDKIAEKDYNLSVNSYVEAKDTREVIVIKDLNEEIEATVCNIDQLRTDIDAIIAEIES